MPWLYIVRGSVRVRDPVTNVSFKFCIHVSSAIRMSTVGIKHWIFLYNCLDSLDDSFWYYYIKKIYCWVELHVNVNTCVIYHVLKLSFKRIIRHWSSILQHSSQVNLLMSLYNPRIRQIPNRVVSYPPSTHPQLILVLPDR